MRRGYDQFLDYPIVLRDNVNTVVYTYSIVDVHILKGLWGLIHNLTTPISSAFRFNLHFIVRFFSKKNFISTRGKARFAHLPFDWDENIWTCALRA